MPPSPSVATPLAPAAAPTSAPARRWLCIQGLTAEGRAFRPSDWAERLAGALAAFRADDAPARAPACWSPLCVPRVIDGVKCVVVDPRLRVVEPLAWDFALAFARDNGLRAFDVDDLGRPLAPA